jgi:L-seryl-tRNA(Ser) seleniumtransferase
MNSFPPKLPWAELYVRSGLKTLSDRVRQRPLVRRVRGAVGDLRTTVRNVAHQRLPDAAATAERMVRHVLAEGDSGMSPLVNATGVIAPRGFSLPLAESAIAAMQGVVEGFSMPSSAVESLITDLTGAEAALVLHSPAAATMSVLGALGGHVVVACDQLGEVDAVPLADLAAFVDARLNGIGSVGRVGRDEYRTALSGSDVGCLWYSKPQSIAVVGDTTAPPAEEVFSLARDRRCPVIEYLEAAMLVDVGSTLKGLQIPIVGASLLAGADLVIFPGDRLIGGPSCGIVVGRSKLVAQVAVHSVARASAVDHARLAALVATLQLTGNPERMTSIPTLQLLSASAENLRHRAERFVAQLAACSHISAVEAVCCPGFLNDGRLPSQQIAGWGVAITPAQESPSQLVQKLIDHRVAASVTNSRVIFNLRSVLARQDEQLATAIQMPFKH